ncbi:MAG TPA: DUF5666 domain-containing protein [Ktedonobacterales bacterium]|jgi:hypothetical protein
MTLLPRRTHIVLFGLLGVAALLLMTACVGVAGGTSQSSSLPGATSTGGVKDTSGGGATTFVPGSLEFTGQVANVSSTSITVSMPDGSPAPAATINAQTDLSDFNGANPSQGQTVKIKENANTDGSFTATELKPAGSGDAQDLHVVKYTGTTTSSLGADNILHFQVGKQLFNFPVSATTQYKDFANAGAIGSNQPIEVTVQFQQGTSTVLEISNPNN